MTLPASSQVCGAMVKWWVIASASRACRSMPAERSSATGQAPSKRSHVSVRGERTFYSYTAKGGIEREVEITDRPTATVVRQLLERPADAGEDLLAYQAGDYAAAKAALGYLGFTAIGFVLVLVALLLAAAIEPIVLGLRGRFQLSRVTVILLLYVLLALIGAASFFQGISVTMSSGASARILGDRTVTPAERMKANSIKG